RKDGTVWCWGANDKGQTGQPLAGGDMCGPNPCRKPTRVDGLSDVVAVASGAAASCAVTKSGSVSCWGQNTHGILGHPSGMDPDCGGGAPCMATPSVVSGVANAVDV